MTAVAPVSSAAGEAVDHGGGEAGAGAVMDKDTGGRRGILRQCGQCIADRLPAECAAGCETDGVGERA